MGRKKSFAKPHGFPIVKVVRSRSAKPREGRGKVIRVLRVLEGDTSPRLQLQLVQRDPPSLAAKMPLPPAQPPYGGALPYCPPPADDRRAVAANRPIASLLSTPCADEGEESESPD